MKYSVVIVDDHVLIAKALQSIISTFEQFEVSYICEHGKELQEEIKVRKKPDIILLDISMPVMDGFETAEWLRAEYPDILVMALSMQDDERSLMKMIKNGAKGYMLKNIHPRELERGLQVLVERGHFFPDWATSKMLTSISDDNIEASLKVQLTEREIEFLGYTTSEMTYKEIGEKMYCSPRTIENYRDSLFSKLEIRSRVGLAMYAVKNGYAE